MLTQGPGELGDLETNCSVDQRLSRNLLIQSIMPLYFTTTVYRYMPGRFKKGHKGQEGKPAQEALGPFPVQSTTIITTVVLYKKKNKKKKVVCYVLFLRDVHLQPFLHDKKGSVRLELLARSDELEVVVAQQPGAHLVDLEEGQIPSDAEMASTTELLRNISFSSAPTFGSPITICRRSVLTWNMYLSILLASSASSNHRSGRNTSASSPKVALSRCSTHPLTARLTPPGKRCPSSSAPSGGTSRVMLSPTAGRTRIASLRHAWKYGRFCDSFHERLPWGGIVPSSTALASSALRRS